MDIYSFAVVAQILSTLAENLVFFYDGLLKFGRTYRPNVATLHIEDVMVLRGIQHQNTYSVKR